MGTKPLRVMIVAGEASGEAVGAALAQELHRRADAVVYGIGGPRMQRAGVRLLYDSSTWSCLGVSESLLRVPRMVSVYRQLGRHLDTHPPQVVVPIDFGAFNVPLARRARQAGVAVLYFMPPRSWDRDPKRRHSVALAATKIATPFPWSATLLRRQGAEAEFVGHPLLDFCRRRKGRRQACATLGLDWKRPVIGLLPGSRLQEMRYVLPLCLDGAVELSTRRSDLQFVLGPAPNIPPEVVLRQVRRRRLDIPLVQDMAYDIMCAADVLIVASGTATLEAACFGTPMVVIYDGPTTGRLEFLLTRHLRHVSLPNIIAGETVVPELLGREAAAPKPLAATVLHYLEDPAERARMLRHLQRVRDALGTGGAIRRTCDLVIGLAVSARPQAHGPVDPPTARTCTHS